MSDPVLGREPLARRRASRRTPLVLVAAHPDDETIGATALMLRTPGCAVVHVTDGAPRDRAFWPAGIGGERRDYAALRRDELRRALAVVGVAEERTFCLGAADQDAVLGVVALARSLAALLRALRPKRVVTHAYEGGHPDHDAAAFICRAAIDLEAAAGVPAAPLFEMTSYHADASGALETSAFLQPSRGPVHTRVLDAVERDAKARMLAAFESQREIVAWFSRDLEQLRRAPRYDFRRPPHEGPLWYERMRFPITGEQWRERVADAEGVLAGAASPVAAGGDGA